MPYPGTSEAAYVIGALIVREVIPRVYRWWKRRR